MTERSGQKGIILVTAMWIMLLISVIAVLITARTRFQMGVARKRIDDLEIQYMAKGVILKVAYDISRRENANLVKTSDVFFRNTYAPVDEPFFQAGIASLKIQDEESLISFNSAPQDVLDLFFTRFDFPENASACLLDWIDEDSDDTNNGLGAESDYYSSLEGGYLCKNAPLSSQEEIFFIREIKDRGNKILSDFTVHGDGKVNINTAPSDTLEYLGFSESLIDKILDYRRGEDLLLYTEDDRWFETPQDIIAKLSEFSYIDEDEKNQINSRLDFLKTSSQFFRILMVLIGQRSQTTYQAEVTIKSEGDSWGIVAWKEP
ncbi:MAG: general secretion pathway protein GspK [Candidatus Aureabacteria bacterium]|nr:general secretion pathway protein GspK [Candidatus Auribacterota bacterium]